MAEKEQLGPRNRLLEAASDVFSQRGFDGTSLRTIADRAGVSFQLIQHYFGNKHDLWLATLDYLYACYMATSKKLEFDTTRDLYTQFREHLRHMMADTLERAQLRRIVILEFFADSDRFHQILNPRSHAFFESVILPYFTEVGRLGILKNMTGPEAAVLWGGMVTNNVVAPEFVEYFLDDPVGSAASIDSQIDKFFELVTQRRLEGGTYVALEDSAAAHPGTGHASTGTDEPAPSNVIYPGTFAAEDDRTILLDAENRRLKQLVGELMLENRLLTDELKKNKA